MVFQFFNFLAIYKGNIKIFFRTFSKGYNKLIKAGKDVMLRRGKIADKIVGVAGTVGL
jgi:hypothetical protein